MGRKEGALLPESVDFSDVSVWSFILQLSILFLAILVGNMLRRRVPFFRSHFIPSAILGGLVVLLLKQIPAVGKLIDSSVMQIITYHCLGLGFAAMALKAARRSQKKVPRYKLVESGAIMAGSYLIQAIVGLVISLIFYFAVHSFYAAGLILPMGFGQSTGSALSWGSNFENSHGFTGGADYGLAVASVGFIVGSVIGVIYLNYANRKGRIRKRRPASGTLQESIYVDPHEIPSTESVDKLTLQICFIAGAYTLAYFFMRLLSLVPIKAINDLAWSLNFLWAMLFASLIKALMTGLRRNHLVTRVYVNDYLMDRFSGTMFDLMIAAGIIAINIQKLYTNLGLLIVTCAAGTIVTFFYVKKVTHDTYKNYEEESFLTNFGTVTGTLSTGMILLREVDPEYVTPAASNIVLQNFFSLFMLAPLLLSIGFAAGSLKNTFLMLGVYIVLFIVYHIYLYRRRLFPARYAGKPDEEWTEP